MVSKSLSLENVSFLGSVLFWGSEQVEGADLEDLGGCSMSAHTSRSAPHTSRSRRRCPSVWVEKWTPRVCGGGSREELGAFKALCK